MFLVFAGSPKHFVRFFVTTEDGYRRNRNMLGERVNTE
jgi:hypothetical protein